MPLLFSYGRLTYKEVYRFLLETDSEFPIPLSSRVDLDIYAKKLSTFSDFSFCRDGNDIVGMISCYTNQPPVGYISNACVKKDYQGAGVFSELLHMLISKVKENDVSALRLEVDDTSDIAQEIYFHLGFVIIQSRADLGKILLELKI